MISRLIDQLTKDEALSIYLERMQTVSLSDLEDCFQASWNKLISNKECIDRSLFLSFLEKEHARCVAFETYFKAMDELIEIKILKPR